MFRKLTVICFGLMLLMPELRADELTQADKEELRERLKVIEAGTKLMQDKHFKAAMDAFNNAMQSEDAAMGLYLKCVEQADFVDLQKKGQDFRDWRRENENRLKSQEFRQALRHQLRWLSLTMRAAARPQEQSKLGPEAQDILRAIVTNAEQLEGQTALLSSPVLGSVFARCYKLTELPMKQWPSSPMEVAAIYDQLILPPLRSAAKVDQLSAAWDLRIQTESAMVEHFSDGKRKIPEDVAMVQFRASTLPKLQWSKEIDLFRNGDQRAAALRMLAHIETNMSHSNAPAWIEEFQSLVNPEASTVKSADAAAP